MIINTRVEAELKKQAKKLAHKGGRSLSNWPVTLIKKEIKNLPGPSHQNLPRNRSSLLPDTFTGCDFYHIQFCQKSLSYSLL